MNTTISTFKVADLIDMAESGLLNPNPIGQRPPTSQGYAKSIGIVTSYFRNGSAGIITLRNISEDEEMQKVYPGCKYLVIDGGHRIRAIRDYKRGKFKVDNRKFIQESEGYREIFLNIDVPIDIKICSSQEAIRIFKDLNETTHVNFIESIMCDDQSEICKYIRSTTTY